jgi:predicted nucleotidyltransferase
MRHYLDAGNQDRIYSEQGDCVDPLNEEFDYNKASARILGRDIGRLLTDTSRLILERVLSREPDQKRADALATVMIRNNANYYGDYNLALATLAELRTGVLESDGF